MNPVLPFCDGLPVRDVAPGETLIEEGVGDHYLYVLIDGELEVSSDGVQVNTQDEPGSVFGEMAALLGMPHTATVKGFTPARVYVIDEPEAFLHSRPEITYQVARLLARRLKGATDYLVDVKNQFEDQSSHLGMVDTVLTSLLNQQDVACEPGSERDPDTTI